MGWAEEGGQRVNSGDRIFAHTAELLNTNLDGHETQLRAIVTGNCNCNCNWEIVTNQNNQVHVHSQGVE